MFLNYPEILLMAVLQNNNPTVFSWDCCDTKDEKLTNVVFLNQLYLLLRNARGVDPTSR